MFKRLKLIAGRYIKVYPTKYSMSRRTYFDTEYMSQFWDKLYKPGYDLKQSGLN